MSERDRYPAGVPCWVDTLSPDPQRLAEFYARVFGWEVEGPGPMPGAGDGGYLVARLRARDVAGIGSLPAGAPHAGGRWNTYIRVESADAAADAARRAGGAVVTEPFDALPAGRMAVLADPEGSAFSVWEAVEREGAELVNEPSAWSMSSLNARDPERVAEFYREVFGWQAESSEFGDSAIVLLRLPGFVGGEPSQPVPRDLVAVAVPLDAGFSGEAAEPHWAVDFWVADTDGVAAATAEAGGEVVVAPHDRPGFRAAVLADPKGAVFSVNQLMVPAG